MRKNLDGIVLEVQSEIGQITDAIKEHETPELIKNHLLLFGTAIGDDEIGVYQNRFWYKASNGDRPEKYVLDYRNMKKMIRELLRHVNASEHNAKIQLVLGYLRACLKENLIVYGRPEANQNLPMLTFMQELRRRVNLCEDALKTGDFAGRLSELQQYGKES